MKHMPGIHEPGSIRRINRYAPFTAVVLLAAIGIGNLSRPEAADAEPYHQRMLEAAEAIPLQIGHWVGRPVEPEAEAVELLRPNVIVSRVYENSLTNRAVNFLLVQCKDARDMAGHYPPNCYPGQGWEIDGQTALNWSVGGIEIPLMEYRMVFRSPEGTMRMIVYNFMILPDGQMLSSIRGVYDAAANYRTHFFGAGQVQLVMDANIPAAERQAIFRELIGANVAVLNTLRSGVDLRQDAAQ